jgi:hypothetical protein
MQVAMNDNLRAWKILAFVLLACSILAITMWAGLATGYLNELPRTPDVPAGRIYPFNYHGFVFYQTHAEKLRLDALLYSFILLAACGLLIAGFKLKMLKLQERSDNRLNFRK